MGCNRQFTGFLYSGVVRKHVSEKLCLSRKVYHRITSADWLMRTFVLLCPSEGTCFNEMSCPDRLLTSLRIVKLFRIYDICVEITEMQ